MDKLNFKSILAIILIGGLFSGYISTVGAEFLINSSISNGYSDIGVPAIGFNPLTILLGVFLPGFIFLLINTVLLDTLVFKNKQELKISPLLVTSIYGGFAGLGALLIAYIIGTLFNHTNAGFEYFKTWTTGFMGMTYAIGCYWLLCRHFKLAYSRISFTTFAVIGFLSIVIIITPDFSPKHTFSLKHGPLLKLGLINLNLFIAISILLMFVKKQKLLFSFIYMLVMLIIAISINWKPVSEQNNRMNWWDLVETNDTSSICQISNLKAKSVLVDNDKQTGLHIACKNGNTAMVKKLVEFYEDLNIAGQYGYPPLFIAPNAEIVKLLLDAGADPNFVHRNKLTPLMYHLVYKSDMEILKRLVEGGADINYIRYGSTYTGFGTPLLMAIGGENYDMIDYLISKGVDINTAERNQLPIFRATSLEMLKYLVSKGAVLPEKMPLEQLIRKNDIESLEYLQSKGVDVGVFSIASMSLQEPMLRYLLDHGANINVTGRQGSAFILHSKIGNVKNVELLIARRCNPRIRDNQGKTALDWAKNDIIKLMISNYIAELDSLHMAKHGG